MARRAVMDLQETVEAGRPRICKFCGKKMRAGRGLKSRASIAVVKAGRRGWSLAVPDFIPQLRNKLVRGAWSRKLDPPKGVIVVEGVSRSLRGVARIAARNSKSARLEQPQYEHEHPSSGPVTEHTVAHKPRPVLSVRSCRELDSRYLRAEPRRHLRQDRH